MADAAEERAEAQKEHAEPFSLRSPVPARPWVIILGVVIGLIFLVLLVIPSVGSGGGRMATQQTAAAARLRMIAAAQSAYQRQGFGPAGRPEYAAHYRDLYYAKDASGQPIMVIDKALADADFSRPGCVPMSGYVFADIPKDAMGVPFDYAKEWAVVAWPAVYNKSGRMTLVIDDTGQVFLKDRGADAPPLRRYPDIANDDWQPLH